MLSCFLLQLLCPSACFWFCTPLCGCIARNGCFIFTDLSVVHYHHGNIFLNTSRKWGFDLHSELLQVLLCIHKYVEICWSGHVSSNPCPCFTRPDQVELSTRCCSSSRAADSIWTRMNVYISLSRHMLCRLIQSLSQGCFLARLNQTIGLNCLSKSHCQIMGGVKPPPSTRWRSVGLWPSALGSSRRSPAWTEWWWRDTQVDAWWRRCVLLRGWDCIFFWGGGLESGQI